MNTYEIIFTRENGTTGSDRFTAPDEKQARKDFRECYRHSTGTITEVKLVSENVPASKEQERKALESIHAIIATLGPNSYLATAFEGCFEIAEENIDNDWACSMKQKAENAETKRIEAELGYNRLVDKLAESEKTIAELEERSLSVDDIADLSKLLSEKVLDLGNEIRNAAERIVENADQTDSAAFRNAVKDHRAVKADLSRYNAIFTRVNTIRKNDQTAE